MNPFSIHCTTCKARLKVQDDSLVGQILSCPKCGSMVQVVPPVDWNVARAESVVPMTTPTDSNGRSPQTPPREPEQVAASAVLNSLPAGIAAPPPLPLEKTKPIAPRLSHVEASSAASLPVATAPASQPGGSMLMLMRMRQDWPMLAGGCAAGAAIAVACLWLALGSGSSNKTAQRDADGTPETASNDNHRPDSPTATDHKTEPDDTAVNAPPVDSSAAPADESSEDEATDEAAQTPGEIPVIDDEELADDGSAVAPQVAPDEMPAGDEAADDEAKPSDEASTDESVVDASTDNALTDDAATDDVEKPTAARSSARAAQHSLIEAHLGDRLSRIEFHDARLAQFVEFLSDFSTIPMRLDVEALAKARKGPKTLVSVDLEDSTVADALKTALERHDLTFEVHDDELVITVKK